MSPIEPIAIVGTACRFPGSASSPSRLWELLREPQNVASKVPADRFNSDAFYQAGETRQGMTNAPESYFLKEDIRAFDAAFFNTSPMEAASMDPQLRLLLEVVYESLERTGLPLHQLQGSSTGVYCGSMNNDYAELLNSDTEAFPPFGLTGTSRSMLATRVSYFFDWQGPSIVIDTACSSSLTAVHLAVEALRNEECPVAVATGSCLILSPDTYVRASQLHMLSSTGRSQAWDEAADGYARGEGVASIILKRLSDAQHDGDEIHGVIRATGTNCDGHSQTITMPNPEAQTKLIRATYARGGLNPLLQEDRCQYFEAHGTGTVAGDRNEAAGIHNAFFKEDALSHGTIYVGSVKTVIGHSESTAGLSGLLKALLAVQHGLIPPNLLFNKISHQVAPYASHLRVPTELIPWPNLPPETPRRASISSFGFGGANTHVILESYSASDSLPTASETPLAGILPFVFSAASQKSLKAVLRQYIDVLDAHPTIDLLDLSSSLLTRRSILSNRVVLTADSVHSLKEGLEEELDEIAAVNAPSIITTRLNQKPKRILGIFTGQGAQWAQMGLDLISQCPQAKAWLQELQESLDTLPGSHRPTFTLMDELAAPESTSRIGSAEVSLPLRTALQIIQVNMLQSLGVEFAAVVGHSSGEIASAYAAGWLISWEEAEAICSEAPYKGSVVVAASNSPSSVTFSGDSETITELEWLFESLDQAPKRLRVDTAYHSHHMAPCVEPYLQAMTACQTGVHKGVPTANWYSSVHNGQLMTELDNEYWCKNMLQPVRFSEALTAALESEPQFDAFVEIGPHPALRAPSLQTISDLKPEDAQMPYIPVSQRGLGAVESLSLAVGLFWAQLGAASINIPSFVELFTPCRRPRYLPWLPTYPFDHSQTFWAVPRLSEARISRRLPKHPLLGAASPETGEGEWRWRNFLRVDELPWLESHQANSQIILPATAYLVMALEAAHLIADGQTLQLVEITDLAIDRAISFPSESAGIETMFNAYQTDGTDESNAILSFACQASFNGTLRRCASGHIRMTFGEQTASLLPCKGPITPGLRAVDYNQLYKQLDMLGLGYSGPFRGLRELQRRKNIAYGSVSAHDSDNDPSLLVHPALLDVSLQALIVAIGSPGDGQMSSLHLPTRLDRVMINPAFLRTGALHDSNAHLTVEATLTEIAKTGITGDINLFDGRGRGFVQVEGMHVSQLTQLTGDDRPMFVKEVWGPWAPQSPSSSVSGSPSRLLTDKLALLHLRDTQSLLTSNDREHLDWHKSRYVAWMDRVLATVRQGSHQLYSPDCLEGEVASLLPLAAKEIHSVEFRTLATTAENLLGWLRGERSLAQELDHENLLPRMRQEAHDWRTMTQRLACLVQQLAFRYPRMKVLEIGGGTLSITQAVLDHLGRNYHSYTYTDVSENLFNEARETFASHDDRLVYRQLDLEHDPIEQGFSEYEYDLVVAGNVLCEHRSLKQTMAYVRRLLKPGGRVAIMETTDPEHITSSFVFGGSDTWWLGETDGRSWGPHISRDGWNQVLQASGFGAFEAISPTEEESKLLSFSVFTSRAINDRVKKLIEPLSVPANGQLPNLILLGGATPASTKLLAAVQNLVGPFFSYITAAKGLEEYIVQPDVSLAVVLNVSDMDSPCLKGLTAERLHSLQSVIGVTGRLLWVATEQGDEDPYLRMSKGLLRSLAFENPHAAMQHLTIRDQGEVSPDLVANTLMRLVHTEVSGDYRLSNCMESAEWELLLEDGTLKVPRMQSNTDMNQRWLASRGAPRNQSLNPAQACVELCKREKRLVFSPSFAENQPDIKGDGFCKEVVQIRVQYATLSAVRINNGFLHLVLGTNERTGALVVALSASHASVVSAPASWCFDISSWPSDRNDAVLDDVCMALLSQHIISHAPAGSTILLHKAPDSLQEALTVVASGSNIQVRSITTDGETSKDSVSLAIPIRRSSCTISRLLPTNASVFATFEPDADHFVSKIKSMFPPGLIFIGLNDFYGDPFPPPGAHHSVAESLLKACLFSQKRSSFRSMVDAVSPQNALKLSPDHQRLRIVDWFHSGLVETDPLPASSLVKLSANKTYLLIGLTGDIGQSVCQWMITRGARSVVLTSRSPKVDPAWLEEMSGLGAAVVVMSMDVADRTSVLQVHERIKSELPSIGGILNGAMVLRDGPFAESSAEDFHQVFAPKVEGSLLLDELYQDRQLDFFLLVGSLSGPVGNYHQSTYAAATEFMAGLVHQRRQRGQVGSIIHPAQIRGVGYLANVDPQLGEFLTNRMGPLILSERDLLELVAEGILAGRPDSGQSVEIMGGYQMTDPAQFPEVLWYRNPKQWPFIEYFQQSGAAESNSKDFPIKAQLLVADSLTAATEIIAQVFSEKLRKNMRLPDDTVLLGTTLLMTLGVDSLVAVDLRIWFVKELGVDIPVLQLLGGSSIDDLASSAAEKLDPSMIPLVGS
ncbi:Type I Polyketide synthases (Type I PKS) [Penicillium canariense]|uniref:Type I Polyketide synthases (Type I PKS) n=1 Tax=Penicillium canariense TaxID=189055 RepID=A0A9W9IF79_9EURO|nr:Type I Polyketide synthases (Type I PKS) [Penicillium canariense]KAJ5174511.1 Type I Polyketide synthases (Type I PKS) [Penicillium canariense]